MSGPAPRTRKRRPDLSQHFLVEACARRLVSQLPLSGAETVVEIGAGRGALTEFLRARSRRLLAVEIDPYLVNSLHGRFGKDVEVIEQDFLEFVPPDAAHVVVGNVPYGRSAEILKKLDSEARSATDAWLIVQLEFAQRHCGRPYLRESVRSLTLKPRWHIEIDQRLRKADFSPPPAVESALLHLSRRERPLVSEDAQGRFAEMIRNGFKQPDLRRALRAYVSKVQLKRLATDYCFAIDDAPGELAFEQWLGVFRFVERLSGRQR